VETIWNDGQRFSGRVALVTGAGGTLGGAVALAFHRGGARPLRRGSLRTAGRPTPVESPRRVGTPTQGNEAASATVIARFAGGRLQKFEAVESDVPAAVLLSSEHSCRVASAKRHSGE
jgi:NAD(P)-dependent dehydrogenase (short-subunit alcohol dehydrogenase family)